MRRREFLASVCRISAGFSLPRLAQGQAGQKRPLIIWVAAFAMPPGKEDLKFKTSLRQ
jgi:hypothetical protein